MGKKLEYLAAFQTTLWGLWLLMPWDTFSISNVYRYMRFIPEWCWGLGVFMFGMVSLFIVYLENERPYSRRCQITIIGIILWTLIPIWLALGDFRGLTISNALGILSTYYLSRYEIQLYQKTVKHEP